MGGKSGKIAARNGKVDGKNGTIWRGCGRVQAGMLAFASGCGWHVWLRMWLFKVYELWIDLVSIELICYKLV